MDVNDVHERALKLYNSPYIRPIEGVTTSSVWMIFMFNEKTRTVHLFTFLVLFSIGAYAIEKPELIDDHDITELSGCWGYVSEGGSYYQNITKCLKQSYALSDAKLNKVYGSTYRTIEKFPRTGYVMHKEVDTEQLGLLKISQRSWIKFRDDECELIRSNSDEGEGEARWLSCMIIQTNTRIRQLQEYNSEDYWFISPTVRG